jgi:NADH dehydrogenase
MLDTPEQAREFHRRHINACLRAHTQVQPVAPGRFSTVGNLMGGLTGGSVMIEGALAGLVYWSLHKMHQDALNGYLKTVLATLANIINTPNRPTIKLH